MRAYDELMQLQLIGNGDRLQDLVSADSAAASRQAGLAYHAAFCIAAALSRGSVTLVGQCKLLSFVTWMITRRHRIFFVCQLLRDVSSTTFCLVQLQPATSNLISAMRLTFATDGDAYSVDVDEDMVCRRHPLMISDIEAKYVDTAGYRRHSGAVRSRSTLTVRLTSSVSMLTFCTGCSLAYPSLIKQSCIARRS